MLAIMSTCSNHSKEGWAHISFSYFRCLTWHMCQAQWVVHCPSYSSVSVQGNEDVSLSISDGAANKESQHLFHMEHTTSKNSQP